MQPSVPLSKQSTRLVSPPSIFASRPLLFLLFSSFIPDNLLAILGLLLSKGVRWDVLRQLPWTFISFKPVRALSLSLSLPLHPSPYSLSQTTMWAGLRRLMPLDRAASLMAVRTGPAALETKPRKGWIRSINGPDCFCVSTHPQASVSSHGSV